MVAKGKFGGRSSMLSPLPIAMMLFVCLASPPGATAQDDSVGQPPIAFEADDRVTLRLVDREGRPVARALVGPGAGAGAREGVRAWRVEGPGGWTDERGCLVFPRELLDRCDPVDASVALYAIHEGRRLAGLILVPLDSREPEVTWTLQPMCRLWGRLESAGLRQAGRELHWANVYVAWGGRRLFECSGWNQRFEFFLPPGQYELLAYGEEVDDAKSTIEIEPGQSELRMEIDLPANRPAILCGRPAPELRNIKGWKNGDPVKLADLRGKVVILDFWGFWCGPCLLGMPKLMELHGKYADKGLVIIAVHDDSLDSIDELDAKLAKARETLWNGRDLPFHIALDGGGETAIEGSTQKAHGATTAAYGVTMFPTALVIDSQGKLVGEYGAVGETRLAEMLGIRPGGNDAKPSLAQAENPVWVERFEQVYRLAPDEVLKRIAPPWIPERAEYYRHTLSDRPDLSPKPRIHFRSGGVESCGATATVSLATTNHLTGHWGSLDSRTSNLRDRENSSTCHCPETGLFGRAVLWSLVCGHWKQSSRRNLAVRYALNNAAWSEKLSSRGASMRCIPSLVWPGTSMRVCSLSGLICNPSRKVEDRGIWRNSCVMSEAI